MVEEYGEDKEICFECRHIKMWHDQWFCKQPSCNCREFVESKVFGGMDLFEAYAKGKEDTLNEIGEKHG